MQIDAQSHNGGVSDLNIKALSLCEQGFYVPAKAMDVR
jgi:hypothetical protein